MNVNETATDIRVNHVVNGLMATRGTSDVWFWYDDVAQVQHAKLPSLTTKRLEWRDVPAEVRNALVSRC